MMDSQNEPQQTLYSVTAMRNIVNRDEDLSHSGLWDGGFEKFWQYRFVSETGIPLCVCHTVVNTYQYFFIKFDIITKMIGIPVFMLPCKVILVSSKQ